MRAVNTKGMLGERSDVKEFTHKFHALDECVESLNVTAGPGDKDHSVTVTWRRIKDDEHLDRYGIFVSSLTKSMFT